MTKVLSFVLLFAVTAYSCAQLEQCRLKTPDGEIDLNYAKASAGYYKITDPTLNIWNYFVQICAPATDFSGIDVCTKKYPDGKGYQLFSDNSDCYPMAAKGGSDVSVTLAVPTDTKKGVILKYNVLDFNNYERSIEIDLDCDPSAPDEPVLTYVREDYSWGSSEYVFKGTTKAACPGVYSSSHNLPLGQYGVGGLLITLLLVAVALYFIIGAIILRFKFEKAGAEMVPHVEFWKDLPLLMKDGTLYIVDGVKLLVAKVSGNKSSGYENMA